jgi:hypothetical protein
MLNQPIAARGIPDESRSQGLGISCLDAADIWSDIMPLVQTARLGTNILCIPNPDSAVEMSRQAVFGRPRTMSDVGYQRGSIDLGLHAAWRCTGAASLRRIWQWCGLPGRKLWRRRSGRFRQ